MASTNFRVDAIEAAKGRRAAQSANQQMREEWFIDQVARSVRLTLQQRVLIATEFLKNKVIINISRPVTKTIKKGKQGRNALGQFTARRQYIVVTNRSKPGEFPKADTTNLMKTIFSDYKESSPGVYDGIVGTPVDYGLFLELFMGRSFLVRTLVEQERKIERILNGSSL